MLDDGSTDGSAEVARSFGPAVRVIERPPRGVAVARNEAITAARGDVLAFLDADDRWDPRWIERALAALADDPELELVFGHVQEFDGEATLGEARAGAVMGGLVARRAVFEHIGPLEEDDGQGEFLEWLLRAREHGVRERTLPEVVLHRRRHEGNRSRSDDTSRDYRPHSQVGARQTTGVRTVSDWRYFIRWFEGSRRTLALSLVLSVAQAAALIPVALLVREALDGAIPDGDEGELVAIGAAIIGLYALSALFGIWTRHLVLSATKAAITRLRGALVKERLHRLPRSYFDRSDLGTVHATVVQDSERLDVMSNGLVAVVLPALVVSAALAVAMLVLNPLLFVLLVAVVPVLMLLHSRLGREVRRPTRIWQGAFDRFSSRTGLALRAMTLTKVLSSARQRDRSPGGPAPGPRRGGPAHRLAPGHLHAHGGLRWRGCGRARADRGWQRGGARRDNVGDLVSFYVLLGLFRTQTTVVLAVLPQVISGAESLARLRTLLESPVEEPYLGTRQLSFGGAIALEHVTFGSAPDRVLSEVSLGVEPGEQIGLPRPQRVGKEHGREPDVAIPA